MPRALPAQAPWKPQHPLLPPPFCAELSLSPDKTLLSTELGCIMTCSGCSVGWPCHGGRGEAWEDKCQAGQGQGRLPFDSWLDLPPARRQHLLSLRLPARTQPVRPPLVTEALANLETVQG